MALAEAEPPVSATTAAPSVTAAPAVVPSPAAALRSLVDCSFMTVFVSSSVFSFFSKSLPEATLRIKRLRNECG